MGENLAMRAPMDGNMNAGQGDPSSSIKAWYDEWPKYNGGFSVSCSEGSEDKVSICGGRKEEGGLHGKE